MLALELLSEYLLGYTGFSGDTANSPSTDASTITRLVIAGNSLGVSTVTESDTDLAAGGKKKAAPKKYGYDSAAYNASPITHLDNFLAEILPSIPVTLMPGDSDPANFSLPQQGIHRAMFPQARAYAAPPTSGESEPEAAGWFDSVTNPWEGDVEGWRLWGCSGQNVDDVLRYLDLLGEDSEEDDSDARLRIMEAMLRWRCGVPTAPDTICTFSFIFFFGMSGSLILTLSLFYRVIPLPRRRSLRPAVLSPHLLHGESTQVRYTGHRGRDPAPLGRRR
jgi:DNA polymerase delta subunit 2